MDTLEKISRPRSLADLAADRIREEIESGRIEMGSALSENQLAEAFGISRTPIRDALSRLEQEGLVEVKAQRGTFVFTMDAEEFRDICDARTALELTALRFCLQRQPDALARDLGRIVDAMAAEREAGDTLGYLRLDPRGLETLRRERKIEPER